MEKRLLTGELSSLVEWSRATKDEDRERVWWRRKEMWFQIKIERLRDQREKELRELKEW